MDGPTIDQLLERSRRGDRQAVEELTAILYDRLHRMAAGYMRSERPDHTLQPTALVHEAFLRLADQRSTDWKDRSHFLAIAATAMRRVLLDHARRHASAKGGGRKTTFDSRLADPGDRADAPLDVLELEEALERLSALDPRVGQLVELRFFGGLTLEEAAEVQGVSRSTADRDWAFARAWLARELGSA